MGKWDIDELNGIYSFSFPARGGYYHVVVGARSLETAGSRALGLFLREGIGSPTFLGEVDSIEDLDMDSQTIRKFKAEGYVIEFVD